MNEDKEREAFYEWEGQNSPTPLEAWLARASIADTAGAKPDGWKLVPITPTLEMQYAAIDTGCCTRPTDAYAAMLEAAPTATPPAPSVADAAGASDVPQDPRYAAWLDFLMSRQLVITHTKDCEYWGVAQVFEDEGEYKLRTVVKPLHDTRIEAVIAAFEKESGK